MRDKRQPITEDRATQPMEAGGRVSQKGLGAVTANMGEDLLLIQLIGSKDAFVLQNVLL